MARFVCILVFSIMPFFASADAIKEGTYVIEGAHIALQAGQLNKFIEDQSSVGKISLEGIRMGVDGYAVAAMSAMAFDSGWSYSRAIDFKAHSNKGEEAAVTCTLRLVLAFDIISVTDCASSNPTIIIEDLYGKVSTYSPLK